MLNFKNSDKIWLIIVLQWIGCKCSVTKQSVLRSVPMLENR